MPGLTVWHGDLTQAYALIEAIAHNCTCSQTPPGQAGCPAHRALGEQRFIDGLLWMRHLRARLLAEEFFDGENA
jgi:hypothetical protein